MHFHQWAKWGPTRPAKPEYDSLMMESWTRIQVRACVKCNLEQIRKVK